MTSLNLQRNSEVFFSTVDLLGGAAVTAMTPSNTWKLEVLAGFAVTASSATQDITSLESGLNPDRSQQRFNTAINPVEWNFQVYLRPTGVETGNTAGFLAAGTNASGNVKPVADWFMWQSLVSNTRASSGTADQSVWVSGGYLPTTNTAAATGSHSTRSNFAIAQEDQYLYFKLDNIIYQVSNASVNQATVDAGIEEIATVTWAGFGTTMRELTGTPRDNAVAVFGGILNAGGAAVVANANAAALTRAASYHPYNQMNVAGTVTTNSFIKNRLSTINFQHGASAGATGNTYSFPVTALTFEYNNNITYLTPEELSALNSPIGNFVGTRGVTGSATMYMRAGNNQSAQFLRNIAQDSRTSSAQTSNANLIIGGTAPYVAFSMPAVQFEFPQVAVEDVLSVSVNFMAQEPNATKGNGGEVTIYVDK